MTTTVQYQRYLEKGILDHGKTVPADVRVLCLWSALGFALTALFCATGFGAEIGLALMMAG